MGIGGFLHKKGLITSGQLKEILAEQRARGLSLYRILMEKGMVEERALLEALALHLNLSFLSLENRELTPEIASALKQELAKKHEVVPIAAQEGEIVVAVSDPMDHATVDDLKFVTGCRVKVVLATREDIRRAQERLYLGDEAALVETAQSLSPDTNVEVIHREEESEADVIELLQKADLPPVVRMSNAIVADAVSVGASDIHIEPMEKEVTVRYRVDGVMRHIMNLPKSLNLSLVSRIKVISKMDIATKMKPQDGRVYVRVGDKTIDIRVSTLPTFHGEKVVMRLLTSEVASLGLESLGLSPEVLESFREAVLSPQGMILVTGPTGSGKTTTLYTTLSFLNTGENNIVTVEDPIEYQLAGVNQVQVKEETGLSFASGLRSILRQDPNIVMLGEIRDKETATIAVQAAQTGHLMLSTLHTLDSVSTIVRLVDLGVDPFLVSASLKCIVAQRLCRKICESCLEPSHPDPNMLARVKPFLDSPESPTFYTGKGCDQCGQTGYKGRMAVFEVLDVCPEVRSLIHQAAGEEKILMQARKEGMKTMFEDGLEKALAGSTSLEEVLKTVPLPQLPKKKRESKPFDPGATQTLMGAVFPKRLADDIVPFISSPTTESDVFTEEKPKPPTILVVDDNKANVLLLKKMLQSNGYAVLEAYDGREALSMASAEYPDLVLSDLHMPKMDGLGLLEGLKAKAQTARIPIILLTAEMRQTVEMTSLEMGADDYISKPVKKGVLLARVRRLLARTRR